MKKMIPICIPMPPNIKITYQECNVETMTNGDMVVTVCGDTTNCETYAMKENKMIYDEALENIKNHDKYNHTLDWGIIVKALERAKKVEELLGLYQKRFSFYNFDEDKSLREIKLKEKELGEMK